MAEFTFAAYTLALAWLTFRMALAGKRFIDVLAENHRKWYGILTPFFDKTFWARTVQLVLDVFASSAGMMFIRVAIAGEGSAPIGALFGLVISAMLTGGGVYYKTQTKQAQTT